MSRKFTRNEALEDISTWSTSDVLHLLRKNGLENCCKAVAKRNVDGDELLHLTEGKLALWKSDLTRPLIWDLSKFVEDVKKTPEKYTAERIVEIPKNEEHLSDTGSWGTDFEDELNEDNTDSMDGKKNISRYSMTDRRKPTEQSVPCTKVEAISVNTISPVEDDETYANCDSMHEDESTYANFHDPKKTSIKNLSQLHGQTEKSLAERLKEELELRSARKTNSLPKCESLSPRKNEVCESSTGVLNERQKSFLYNALKVKSIPALQTQRRMNVPPPPEPIKIKDSILIEKPIKDLQKAPATIRNFDLLANLPPRTEESEDEYEPFDEQIIEQNQKKNISRVNSKQSLTSGHQSSLESVYQPPSITSHEEMEEPYEIYESITETPDDDSYHSSSVQKVSTTETPPPLPSKPQLPSKSPSPNLNKPKTEPAKERSPDKKSATLPHPSSNYATLSERATRPLPPPPDRQSYTDKPWFHNVTREQAAALIKEQSTYGNPQDGHFLLRPSTTNINNPLALVLWYKDRFYNVPVRKRPDNRYALGTAKINEQSFSNVEEIVLFYSREELVLHTGGSTRLTETPPK